MTYKKLLTTKYLLIFLTIAIVLNLFQFIYPKIKFDQAVAYNQDQKISEIESYLDQISPQFIIDVKNLAAQYNIPSWGCGPSSYALGKILNHKFFGDKLTLDGTYDNQPYEIVQRFGLAGIYDSKGVFIIQDHAWIEIYLRDKLLFIDPTDAQFGNTNKIAYEVFEVGDPNMAVVLKSKYNIVDYRISLLVQKTINRIPASQQPYPGVLIPQQNLDYFLGVVDTKKIILSGGEPDNWDYWTNTLTKKYE
jgi:hypothetical protein